MESAYLRYQRVPQASHRRGRLCRSCKRAYAQDHQRANEKDKSFGGTKMKDVFIGQVGIWGQRHYQYLKENKATMVNVMRMNGTLKQYLREVDEQAEEMLYGLVRQMAKDEGVNEALKRQDQMLWVQRMNSIRNRAEEIVLKDLIFV